MIGKTIGRYQILGELGRGAMTIVYLAYDPAFERQVAVKVLVRHVLNDPTFRRRFRHEMKMIATLEHPAIVPAYDWGEDDGHLFMAMRLMSGGSLSDYLNNGALPLTMILHIISHLAPALDEAHARGIVHGDLKPSKILFDESGMPYINGFGTTKPIMGSMTRLTLSYPLIGTFAYMSPEQALGEENIDGRSDIYSLGVILFEMLSGRLPYDANTPASFIYQHIHKPIPNIRSFRPDLPLHCQTVIDRAMAKLPQARYPTAAALSADLTAPVPLWQRYPPSAPPAAYSQPMVLIKFSLFAVVLLFFGIVIFSGITILSAPTPGPELAVPWVEANWW